MEDKEPNEYNSIGAPSEDVKRKLLYLAEIGSEAVTSAFRASAGSTGHNTQEKRDTADEQFHALAVMATASQERIAQFHADLENLDARRIELIGRIDDDLRVAREERERLLDDAEVVTFPDGTMRKVFREKDHVRDESGALIGREIAKAEEVSDNPHQWRDNLTSKARVTELEVKRERLVALGEDMENARERAYDGKLSGGELDRLTADFEKALAAEEQELVQQQPDGRPDQLRMTASGLETDIFPMIDFERASSGAVPDLSFEEEFTPPTPAASTPAPV